MTIKSDEEILHDLPESIKKQLVKQIKLNFHIKMINDLKSKPESKFTKYRISHHETQIAKLNPCEICLLWNTITNYGTCQAPNGLTPYGIYCEVPPIGEPDHGTNR